MERSVMEEHTLPGAYHIIPNEEHCCNKGHPSATLPLDLISSVLFPRYPESTMNRRWKNNRRSVPGAWIGDGETENSCLSRSRSFSSDELNDKENTSHTNPIPTDLSDEIREAREAVDQLRKETSQLEETGVIVQRSIQIVARKRRKYSPWDWCEDSEEEQTYDEAALTEDDDEEDLDWELI